MVDISRLLRWTRHRKRTLWRLCSLSSCPESSQEVNGHLPDAEISVSARAKTSQMDRHWDRSAVASSHQRLPGRNSSRFGSNPRVGPVHGVAACGSGLGGYESKRVPCASSADCSCSYD